MHYRFLVTVNKDKAESSEQARQLVSETLLAEGFVADGRWGCGQADWFVIGGRWSGELSRASWTKDLNRRMRTREEERGVQVWGAWYGDPEKQKIQKELERTFRRMWRAETPAAYVGIPVDRDTYQEYGYEDDAMILTEELYTALLKEYEGQCQSEHHADLEDEAISPDMVGRKWLVVVDYHN